MEVAIVGDDPPPGQTVRPYPAGGHSYSIHDIVADGRQYLPGCYGSSCSPYFNEFLTNANAPGLDEVLHDIKIEHITEVLANQPSTSLMALAGRDGPLQMYNLTVENSIIPAGEYGIMSGDGGRASRTPGPQCPSFKHASATSFLTIMRSPTLPPGAGGDWGKGNFLLNDQNAVGFVAIADLDFHLSNSSRYKKKELTAKTWAQISMPSTTPSPRSNKRSRLFTICTPARSLRSS